MQSVQSGSCPFAIQHPRECTVGQLAYTAHNRGATCVFARRSLARVDFARDKPFGSWLAGGWADGALLNLMRQAQYSQQKQRQLSATYPALPSQPGRPKGLRENAQNIMKHVSQKEKKDGDVRLVDPNQLHCSELNPSFCNCCEAKSEPTGSTAKATTHRICLTTPRWYAHCTVRYRNDNRCA